MGEDQKEKHEGLSIDDFVIPQKVNAFCEHFLPETNETSADEIFTDAKLRKYFQAYPRNIGDPLISYLNLLEIRGGFIMRTSTIGEPAIFVRYANKSETSHTIEMF